MWLKTLLTKSGFQLLIFWIREKEAKSCKTTPGCSSPNSHMVHTESAVLFHQWDPAVAVARGACFQVWCVRWWWLWILPSPMWQLGPTGGMKHLVALAQSQAFNSCSSPRLQEGQCRAHSLAFRWAQWVLVVQCKEQWNMVHRGLKAPSVRLLPHV